MHEIRRSTLLGAALLLSACGGGGGGGGDVPPPTPNNPPAAPALAVDANTKQLVFSWAGVPTATHYRLMQNPDGGSGFIQVGGVHGAGATSAALDIAVHRHDWANALYRLEACNAHGCTASVATSAVSVMLQSIGFFKASNIEPDDVFGVALALSADGGTLAVGAHLEDSKSDDQSDNSAVDAGAVYVFVRAGATWSQQAYVKADNAEVGALFGASVALSDDGDTLAIGAPFESSNALRAGAAYVFTRDGSQWSQQAYVKASNPDAGDNFGLAIALSGAGDMLAVAAPYESSSATGVNGAENDNSAPVAGAVYVFARMGTQWEQRAYVKASNTQQGDEFGSSLAISADGSTLAVGARQEESSAGAAYVFARGVTAWAQQAYVKASNTGADDNFGSAVALSGDGNTLVVGARGEGSNATGVDGNQANNSAPRAGAAYIFARAAATWSQQAYVKASNTEKDDLFGYSVDLSDDGDTLVIGAPGEGSRARGVDGDQTDSAAPVAGAAYVLRRSGAQWSQQQVYVKASNTDAQSDFGFSVALSADGDALAIGAPYESSNDAPRSGAAYIF